MDPSPAVERRIREKAAKLEKFFDRVVGCHVTVKVPNKRGRNGKLYSIVINLGVPGRELVIRHARPKDHAHKHIQVAVRDAFDAAACKLEDHARKMRPN